MPALRSFFANLPVKANLSYFFSEIQVKLGQICGAFFDADTCSDVSSPSQLHNFDSLNDQYLEPPPRVASSTVASSTAESALDEGFESILEIAIMVKALLVESISLLGCLPLCVEVFTDCILLLLPMTQAEASRLRAVNHVITEVCNADLPFEAFVTLCHGLSQLHVSEQMSQGIVVY